MNSIENEVAEWKPIVFDENWSKCSVAKLDKLLPSWLHRREQLKKQGDEYEKSLDRSKRQHAIETGIIEKLYDLKEGISETLLKKDSLNRICNMGTQISTNRL